MNQLREIVRQYVTGAIDFATFRRAMVVDFLSSRTAGDAVESVATAIDIDCSDFSEGLIPEDQLKRDIVLRLQPQQTSNISRTVLFVANYDLPVEFPNLESPTAASGTCSGVAELVASA